MGLELVLWNPFCLKTNNKYTEGEGRGDQRQQLQLLLPMHLTATLLLLKDCLTSHTSLTKSYHCQDKTLLSACSVVLLLSIGKFALALQYFSLCGQVKLLVKQMTESKGREEILEKRDNNRTSLIITPSNQSAGLSQSSCELSNVTSALPGQAISLSIWIIKGTA